MSRTRKQVEYIEAASMVVAVGLAAQGGVLRSEVPALSFNLAEQMLDEREKRYGKVDEVHLLDD